MGLETNIAAVVAALDLKLVKLLRAAMNTPAGGVAGPGGLGPAATFEGRGTIEPEPRIAPRPVIHPTPRFEPRPVIHPEPRVDSPGYPVVVLEGTPPCDCGGKSPIEPPWRVLPWEPAAGPIPAEVAQPARRVKPPIVRPDTVCKGTLIDFFC